MAGLVDIWVNGQYAVGCVEGCMAVGGMPIAGKTAQVDGESGGALKRGDRRADKFE